MKIINREDGQEVVYLQKGDLAYLMHNCDTVPYAFVDDFFSDVVIIDNSNRDEFVRFTNQSEVDFAKEQDWIIDLRDYIMLNEDELVDAGKKVAEEDAEIIKKHNEANNDEARMKLSQQHNLLEYKFYSIRDFLWYRQGYIKYNIPQVPDSEGLTIKGDNDIGFIMKSSIDPYKLLIYKRNGEPINSEEEVPREFINNCMSLAVMEKMEKDAFFGYYVTKDYLSEDKKYYVLEFKIMTMDKEAKEEKKEEPKKEDNRPIKEKGIKRLIKSIFNKKSTNN